MSDIPEPHAPEPDEIPVEFWSDPGPGFNPDEIPAPPEDRAEPAEPEGWTPERVVQVLQEIQAPIFNGTVNPLLGVSNVDWHHRQARLEAVAPAIAREWNKIDVLRGLAGATDRALIGSYLAFEYLGPRAIQVAAERREIARQQAASQPQQQAQFTAPAPDAGGEEPAENPDVAKLAEIPPRRR